MERVWAAAGDVGPKNKEGRCPTMFFELADHTTTVARVYRTMLQSRARPPAPLYNFACGFFCGVAACGRAECPTSPAAL
jgi:hypothetical protein